ncbi:MAG: prepilin peptidase [Planctomycetaceae bacterium]|nr:prepilin peptidase [Planctomycetaceae bacterium]
MGQTLWNSGWPLLQWGLVLAACALAAGLDLKRRRIPGALTVAMALSGIVWALWWCGWGGLADALTGGLLAMIPYVLLFAWAGGDAANARLMAAIGVWLGTVNALWMLGGVLLAAVAMGVIVSVRRRVLANVVDEASVALYDAIGRIGLVPPVRPAARQNGAIIDMPYGLSIFIGTCLAAAAAAAWHIGR